jgi:cytochrome c peroxidase
MPERLLTLTACAALLTACGDPTPEPAPDAGGADAWAWELPEGFPEPRVPEDNPMSAVKVELGRRLFYDTRMSLDGTFSCGTCHLQELAFTDGRAQGLGVTGQLHPRSSMSLANVAYFATLNWANPNETALEHQALGPMFGTEPVELGLADREDELFATLGADPTYVDLFARAFPEADGAISVDTITKALAAFQRTLISGSSPFDRYVRGDSDALSESAVRGLDLFFGEQLECFHCHNGFTLADSVDHSGQAFVERPFHNTGLYNLDPLGSYPERNEGLFTHTGKLEDMGRFRAPSLRNIAVTAPYMHDGSIPDLDGVIDHYAAGGRTIAEGEYAGVGAENPNKSEFVTGFVLTDQERADLKAFLESLTDEAFLTDPRFSDPFEQDAE